MKTGLQDNERVKWCDNCNCNQVFTEYAENWGCQACGLTGYWNSVETLFDAWCRAWVDGVDEWFPEEETGMKEHHEEILIKRLRYQRNHFESLYKETKNKLQRYKDAFKLLKEGGF